MRLLFILLLASGSLFAQHNYEFKNGYWYNGKDFTAGTWYTQGGVFSKKAPSKIDSVIDLNNRYVIPPMGDAYCSSVAGNPSAEAQLKSYMNEGVFYLQVLGNTRDQREKVEAKRKPTTNPDVAYANGEITCTLGSPFVKYEAAAMDIRNNVVIASKMAELKKSRKALGDGYWFIDNKAALSANWSKIKAQKPSVISIWLLDAEQSGGKEGFGLSPDMAKAVIKKAHKAKLKVYAHVENASDLRLAVQLGADGIANLPGMLWNGEGDKSIYELTDADIKWLEKKQTVIIPLLSKAQINGTVNENLKTFQAQTLTRLLNSQANVAIGSDDTQRTTRTEFNYWFGFNQLNSEAALKVLCERTPRAIFPERKIGRIDAGYEASFLVLDDNPIGNLLKTRIISLKVKNGILLK